MMAVLAAVSSLSWWPVAAVGGAEVAAGEWFTAQAVMRVVTLQDYNTRVVVLGTGMLGLAAGIIGTFMLLRKRALLGDALSHATLPGIAIAFLTAVAFGGTGKSLGLLLTGATITGVAGVGVILFVRHFTRLKEDAALGVVLSVFFGAGVALMGIVQKTQSGHAAGLESFIYGKTASMTSSDAVLIGVAGLVVALVCALLYKELKLLCYDSGFAASQGWPVILLDVVMMAMVVVITVIGLQAVGLILVIALLVIPPAAARFWTDRMFLMIVIAGVVGAIGSMAGAGVSALTPNLPSGAMIVLTVTAFFLLSMFFGGSRGIVPRWVSQRRLSVRVARQNLLRALYEWAEGHAGRQGFVTVDQARQRPMSRGALLKARSWSVAELGRLLGSARRDGLIEPVDSDRWYLTDQGLSQAQRVVRNHRLWETFLIHFADVAPSHVDRDADAIEHVLAPEMLGQLEELLGQVRAAVPGSPHPVTLPPNDVHSGRASA